MLLKGEEKKLLVASSFAVLCGEKKLFLYMFVQRSSPYN